MANPNFEERLGRFRLFKGLTRDELAQIAAVLQEKTFRAGSILFQQGDPADFFYLVERGAVEEVGRDQAGAMTLHRLVQAGEFVGRWALMHATPRRATATASRLTRTLVMDADSFRTIVATFPQLEERLWRTQIVNRLWAIPLFGSFTREQLFHVADLAREVEYPAGQTIFEQDEVADAFYVIDTGQVIETAEGDVPGTQSWPKYLTAGSFFGRYGLLHQTTRRATAQARTDVRLFRFEADAFEWLRQWQPAFERNLERPDILGCLRRSGVFANLSEEELKHLSGYVGLAHFRPGELVYRQGELDPTFYILYQGEAIARHRDEQGRDTPRKTLRAVTWMGQSSLFLKVPRDVTAEATTSSDWMYLTRQDLDQFLAQRPKTEGKLMPREDVAVRRNLKRLPWMEADEQLLLRSRRHWFFLIHKLAPPVLLFLACMALALTLLFKPIGLLLLVPASAWTLWRFLDWFNDYYLVTTQRVAHREKVYFVSEQRDETPLDKIQNVNINQNFVGNRLNFGTLFIDTAGALSVTRVTFDHLPDPAQVQALIFEQIERARAGKRVEMHEMIRDSLAKRVGTRVRPSVPRPVSSSPSPVAPPPSPRPSAVRRFYDFAWGNRVWIEIWTEQQVTWRKHWIRLLEVIWLPTLVNLGLLFLFSLAVALFPVFGLLGILFVGLLLAPGLFWFWWNWVNWGNDQYIVTNDRLIDTTKLPLGFRTTRTETTFDKIQNVNFTIPNPIATLLNYGTVSIYTAGVQGRLDFEYVRDPRKVQAEIFRRLAAYSEARRRQQQQEQLSVLPEWFAEYEGMRRP
jgi:CRP-like cAMP-binding protein/membrane protein YdbS with pleckstrin-like domain